MPIKRTTAQDGPPNKKRAPRRKRQEPEAQAASSVGGHEPVISQDEKRRLILAHAAMRPTRDPVQLMSMWAGVLVAVLAVVSGWWWSVGSGIAGSWQDMRGIAQEVQRVGKEATESDVARELQQVADRLDALQRDAEARQRELEDLMRRQAADGMPNATSSEDPSTSPAPEAPEGASTTTNL
jgi:hypothetical protein